jgi:hypothetical protein
MQDDVLQDMPPVPANFVLRKTIPQLDILTRCSAFVTHGGANSMHEALIAGVPMVVVPLFADQPANADSVVGCGAGIAFHNPITSLTAAALSAALQDLSKPSPDNSYQLAVAKMSKKLSAAGGVAAAADAIMEHANHVKTGRQDVVEHASRVEADNFKSGNSSKLEQLNLSEYGVFEDLREIRECLLENSCLIES